MCANYTFKTPGALYSKVIAPSGSTNKTYDIKSTGGTTKPTGRATISESALKTSLGREWAYNQQQAGKTVYVKDKRGNLLGYQASTGGRREPGNYSTTTSGEFAGAGSGTTTEITKIDTSIKTKLNPPKSTQPKTIFGTTKTSSPFFDNATGISQRATEPRKAPPLTRLLPIKPSAQYQTGVGRELVGLGKERVVEPTKRAISNTKSGLGQIYTGFKEGRGSPEARQTATNLRIGLHKVYDKPVAFEKTLGEGYATIWEDITTPGESKVKENLKVQTRLLGDAFVNSIMFRGAEQVGKGLTSREQKQITREQYNLGLKKASSPEFVAGAVFTASELALGAGAWEGGKLALKNAYKLSPKYKAVTEDAFGIKRVENVQLASGKRVTLDLVPPGHGVPGEPVISFKDIKPDKIVSEYSSDVTKAMRKTPIIPVSENPEVNKIISGFKNRPEVFAGSVSQNATLRKEFTRGIKDADILSTNIPETKKQINRILGANNIYYKQKPTALSVFSKKTGESIADIVPFDIGEGGFAKRFKTINVKGINVIDPRARLGGKSIALSKNIKFAKTAGDIQKLTGNKVSLTGQAVRGGYGASFSEQAGYAGKRMTVGTGQQDIIQENIFGYVKKKPIELGVGRENLPIRKQTFYVSPADIITGNPQVRVSRLGVLKADKADLGEFLSKKAKIGVNKPQILIFEDIKVSDVPKNLTTLLEKAKKNPNNISAFFEEYDKFQVKKTGTFKPFVNPGGEQELGATVGEMIAPKKRTIIGKTIIEGSKVPIYQQELVPISKTLNKLDTKSTGILSNSKNKFLNKRLVTLYEKDNLKGNLLTKDMLKLQERSANQKVFSKFNKKIDNKGFNKRLDNKNIKPIISKSDIRKNPSSDMIKRFKQLEQKISESQKPIKIYNPSKDIFKSIQSKGALSSLNKGFFTGKSGSLLRPPISTNSGGLTGSPTSKIRTSETSRTITSSKITSGTSGTTRSGTSTGSSTTRSPTSRTSTSTTSRTTTSGTSRSTPTTRTPGSATTLTRDKKNISKSGGMISNPSYNVFVKIKGKNKQVNKYDNLNFHQASTLGSRIADNTTARSFLIKKGKNKIITFNNSMPSNINKFYRPSKERNPKLTGFYIEKNKHTIDTKGEKKGLSASKFLRGFKI